MSEEKPVSYLAARYLEILCISLFIFGFLWNGTEMMNLTTPQFLMLYGGSGAVICEALARLFMRFSKKKRDTQVEVKNG
jgi:predicted acyltransferase